MLRKLLTTAILVAVPWAAVASEEDELTSLSYISYMERYATVQPASGNESIEAVINLPLMAGDRIDTAREARVEVVLSDSSVVWLDEYTSLSFDTVAFSRDTKGDRSVLYLAEGRMMVEIPDNVLGQYATRIDSGSETVYLNEPGLYRVETLRPGGLRVEVWTGLAEALTSAGGVLIRSNYAAEVSGGSIADIVAMAEPSDAFAQWVGQRRQVGNDSYSLQYVDERHGRQAAELDNYGTWVYLESDNSWAWQPSVGSDWSPYSAGRWYWTSTGWSWISYEPWGWLPYHYGSWYQHANYGWVWGWHSYWSPAWVHWMWWPGHVGWCPSGYYSYWWGGYYGWHHWGGGGHGGGGGHHPGGGHGNRPSRRDVVPVRTASALAEPTGDRRDVRPAEAALDVNGSVRVGAVDRTGWNVVSDRDFASPNLARVVKPAEVAFTGHENVEAVITSGSLRTASPTRYRPSEALERTFTEVQARETTDVTAVLARDGSVSAERFESLVRPTTVAELSRRSTSPGTSTLAVSDRSTMAAPANQQVSMPSATGFRPARTAPNIYRPVVTSSGTSTAGSGRVSPSGATLGDRPLRIPAANSTGSGSSSSTVTGSRPLVVRPGSGSTTSTTGSGVSSGQGVAPTPQSTRTSTSTGRQFESGRAASATPPRTRSTSSTSRGSFPTAGSAPVSKSPSRLVIVPRTSSSTSSRSSTPTRSAPSSRSSSATRGSSSSGSRPTARSSSGSSSSSRGSSSARSGSSRSSSSRSSSARSSSGSRSSGGSRSSSSGSRSSSSSGGSRSSGGSKSSGSKK